MSHQASIRMLEIACFVVIGFGLLLFSTLWTPTAGLLHRFVDLAFLPVDGAQNVASDPAWLMTAISGGVLAGWGVMAWLVTTRVFAHEPSAGKAIILPSLLVWFVIDGAGSILVGAWFNMVMNTAFLLMFAVPVLSLTPRPGATAS
ncbi:MAG: excinuclease ABC subunit A [Pseudomonadota bacterium]